MRQLSKETILLLCCLEQLQGSIDWKLAAEHSGICTPDAARMQIQRLRKELRKIREAMGLPFPASDDDTKAPSASTTSSTSGRKYKVEKTQKSPRNAPIAPAKRGRKKTAMYEMLSPQMVGNEDTHEDDRTMGMDHNMNGYSTVV